MALMDSYDGFIFDYGKVLVRDQAPSDLDQMASAIGVSRGEFEEMYWKHRLDYDKALLTAVDYWNRATGRLLKMDDINTLIQLDCKSWLHFDEPMWDFVNDLKASGKRVAILSNMPAELGENIKATTQRFSLFHHVTLSYEVKSVKPEPAIYEHCLAGIGTPLKKTIFFDDKIVNVKGAEMLGLDAIEFLDRDEVLKKLRG